jgi:hypothetical protein
LEFQAQCVRRICSKDAHARMRVSVLALSHGDGPYSRRIGQVRCVDPRWSRTSAGRACRGFRPRACRKFHRRRYRAMCHAAPVKTGMPSLSKARDVGGRRRMPAILAASSGIERRPHRNRRHSTRLRGSTKIPSAHTIARLMPIWTSGAFESRDSHHRRDRERGAQGPLLHSTPWSATISNAPLRHDFTT